MKTKSRDKITAIIVFFGCVLLFTGVVYLLATDVDFFLNKQIVDGKFKIVKEVNNKIEINITYYDKYKNGNVEKTIKIGTSFRNKLQTLDSNNVTIIYTKWFNQAYISEIKKPRILILLLEIIMMLFCSLGMKWGWKELLSLA